MKLFVVYTIGIYASSEKTFVVMAERESEVEETLINKCSSYSQFHDKITKIIPSSGGAVRVQ